MDVGNVYSMEYMFYSYGVSNSINQDLSNWNVENVLNCYIFDGSYASDGITPLESLWVLPQPNFTNCSSDSYGSGRKSSNRLEETLKNKKSDTSVPKDKEIRRETGPKQMPSFQ